MTLRQAEVGAEAVVEALVVVLEAGDLRKHHTLLARRRATRLW